jgi:HK97 family phage major capsid protein
MNKLKQLNETVGGLKKEIRTYLDSDARKTVTDKENDPKLKELETRFAGAAADLDAEIRQSAREGEKAPILSKDEVRTVDRFDFSRVVNHLHRQARGSAVAPLDGAEAELIQEGEKEARAAGLESAGIMLPSLLVRRGGYNRSAERRDMTATGTTSVTLDQGGMTIATEKKGLLDDFFNGSVIRQAGATVLPGLVGKIDIPRLVAGTAPAKKTENQAADEVTPTTAMLSLQAKRLPAYIDISESLLRQSGLALEAILGTHLTNQMLAVQEAAFFHGGGTSEAYGIAGTSGIGSVVGDTNGIAPTLAHIIALETAVDTSNALLGNLRYVSNGQIRGKLKGTAKVASTDSRMLLDSDGLLNGYQPLFTNAVSRTLTKGSSSLASAIFFGNFADYYVGYWGGMSLEMVRDKTNAIAGLYTLVASAYYDGGVVRPKSFAAMLDALGA